MQEVLSEESQTPRKLIVALGDSHHLSECQVAIGIKLPITIARSQDGIHLNGCEGKRKAVRSVDTVSEKTQGKDSIHSADGNVMSER